MKTILLIEDHEMMRLFLTNYFGSDYQVYSVATAEEASIWLQINTADLILADFPKDPNGFSIYRLSQLAMEKSIPLLVMTDQDKSEQRIKAFQWGAKDSVSKPFNPTELKLRVNALMPNMAKMRAFSSVA